MEMAKLSVNLWNLANKHENVDRSIAVSILTDNSSAAEYRDDFIIKIGLFVALFQR
jgi:hypothetical protein